MKKLIWLLALAIQLSCAALSEDATPLPFAARETALSLQDFNYFPDFPIQTGNACEGAFPVSDPDVVAQALGKPTAIEVDGYSTRLTYPFGWVLLEREDAGGYWSLELLIYTDELEGPRGLRIGDAINALLATFQPEDTDLPMLTNVKDQENISLYHLDANDGATTHYGYAVYLGGRLVTVEYGMHAAMQYRCSASFEVGGGTIEQIRWRVSCVDY